MERYPDARFVSTAYTETDKGKARLLGDLTLHGVTRQIEIDVKHVGAGTDPWGGYRRGFEGTASITLADFGMTKFLGEAARQMEFSLGIEGIRKKSSNRPLRPGGLRIR